MSNQIIGNTEYTLRPILEKQMFEEIQGIQLIQNEVDVTPLKDEIAARKHYEIVLIHYDYFC